MRVCCFGDIHYYGVRKDLERLARNVGGICSEADAAVIVGDITSSGNLGYLEEVLGVVRRAIESLPILVIPGNHDIYVLPDEVSKGINSLLKVSMFNSLVEKLGCVAPMKKPYIVGSTAFVGSIGWYDYSFAPDYLGLSLEDFRTKAFGLYVWADKDYVRLPFSDEEFTLHLLNMFEEHIKKIYNSVEKIVAVLHHLPFRKLVKYELRPEWGYFSAFMGSEAFGHVIKKYSKVKLVLYGHSHDGVETGVCKEVEGIKCYNCATPYPMIVDV